MPNGVTTNYTYDNASRLLELKHIDSLNAVLESINYVYDPNGNRTSMNRFSSFSGLTGESSIKLPNPDSDITYNQANQMLTFQPENKPVKNMTYDENGNLFTMTNSCGTTTYTWNARNQLVGINGFNSDYSKRGSGL